MELLPCLVRLSLGGPHLVDYELTVGPRTNNREKNMFQGVNQKQNSQSALFAIRE